MNLRITGAWQQAKKYIPQISEKHDVIFLQHEKEELPCDPAWVEGIICNGFFLSHPIEVFCNLKYIQLTSAGYDRVPMNYVREHGIVINNARGVYSIPMAEMAVTGVLQLCKKMGELNRSQKNHQWEKQRNLQELAGKTVAIIGCGSVGTACAKRFKAFDTCVVGIDLFTRKDDNFDSMEELRNLDTVLAYSDVVVITVPLTEETKWLMNAERFVHMKGTAVLVNIARGAIVETTALVNWVNNGGMAFLDVFEEEPLSEDSPLWDLKNVIITPHNSFISEGNDKRLKDVIMKNLLEYSG